MHTQRHPALLFCSQHVSDTKTPETAGNTPQKRSAVTLKSQKPNYFM